MLITEIKEQYDECFRLAKKYSEENKVLEATNMLNMAEKIIKPISGSLWFGILATIEDYKKDQDFIKAEAVFRFVEESAIKKEKETIEITKLKYKNMGEIIMEERNVEQVIEKDDLLAELNAELMDSKYVEEIKIYKSNADFFQDLKLSGYGVKDLLHYDWVKNKIPVLTDVVKNKKAQ